MKEEKSPVVDLGMDMEAVLTGFVGKDGSYVAGHMVRFKPGKKAEFFTVDRLKAIVAGLQENIALMEDQSNMAKNLLAAGGSFKWGKMIIPDDSEHDIADEEPPSEEEPSPVVSEVTAHQGQSSTSPEKTKESYGPDQVANLLQKLGL